MKTIPHEQTLLPFGDEVVKEFNESREHLKAAVDRFGASLSGLLNSSPPDDPADEAAKATRKAINRSIRILADQSGMQIHTIWVLAYHEHFKRTGFHAVIESGSKGKHLDAVQAEGQLDGLMETVNEMLKMDEFRPHKNHG